MPDPTADFAAFDVGFTPKPQYSQQQQESIVNVSGGHLQQFDKRILADLDQGLETRTTALASIDNLITSPIDKAIKRNRSALDRMDSLITSQLTEGIATQYVLGEQYGITAPSRDALLQLQDAQIPPFWWCLPPEPPLNKYMCVPLAPGVTPAGAISGPYHTEQECLAVCGVTQPPSPPTPPPTPKPTPLPPEKLPPTTCDIGTLQLQWLKIQNTVPPDTSRMHSSFYLCTGTCLYTRAAGIGSQVGGTAKPGNWNIFIPDAPGNQADLLETWMVGNGFMAVTGLTTDFLYSRPLCSAALPPPPPPPPPTPCDTSCCPPPPPCPPCPPTPTCTYIDACQGAKWITDDGCIRIKMDCAKKPDP